jgi:hypothetical protein
MYEARCRACFVPHADAPTIHEEETEKAAVSSSKFQVSG